MNNLLSSTMIPHCKMKLGSSGEPFGRGRTGFSLSSLANLLAGAIFLLSSPGASAFSFWVPNPGWQTETLGYYRLDHVDYPNGGVNNIIDDFSYHPGNIGEEYRWNVPNLFYVYDPTFVEYFGSNGVASVERSFNLLNALPKASEADLGEFPLDEYRFNFAAISFHLFDLRSAALEALVTRLGLADPERWTWALHDRVPVPTLPCPNFFDTVVQFNFDPFTWLPSRYVNGNIHTYFVDQPCPPDIRGDRADAVELRVNPLDKNLTAVSSPKITAPSINFYGMFHVSMTRDDVAGLRFLYHTNNMNVEQSAPGVQLFQTNQFAQLLVGSNLTLFAAQALTNNAAALTALYPGLTITSSTNFGWEPIWTTNIVAYLTNGPPWAPPGSLTIAFATNVVPTGVQFLWKHTFANTFQLQLIGGQYTAVPMPVIPTNGVNRYIQQNISVVVTNKPGPFSTNNFILVTNSVNLARNRRMPVGEFFIAPSNTCDLQFLGVVFTNVVRNTNIIVTSTNITIGFTNAAGNTNVFVGQVVSNTIQVIDFFTNHFFVVLPVTCDTDTVALRQGLDKISFIRQDFDPIFRRFFRPITNDFSGIAETTNHIRYIERFRRVITAPDIVLQAQDLDFIIPLPMARDAGPGTLTAPGSSQGTFTGPMTLTFNKGGPVFLNQTPAQATENDAIFFFQWGSFDGSTNDPILYPDTSSITNLERAFAMTVQPAFLPTATLGQDYSADLQVTGGQVPYTWSIAGNSLPLPAGLTLRQDPLDSSHATISGIPTELGTFPFRIQIIEGGGLTVNAAEGVEVNPP